MPKYFLIVLVLAYVGYATAQNLVSSFDLFYFFVILESIWSKFELQATFLWSDKRMKNYATGNTCIYAAYSDRKIKSSVCDTTDAFVISQQVPSVSFFFELFKLNWILIFQHQGYQFAGWFQLTFKINGYGTYCLQAGAKTGYGQATNGDPAVVAPCVGDEPTQIWKIHDTWNVRSTWSIQIHERLFLNYFLLAGLQYIQRFRKRKMYCFGTFRWHRSNMGLQLVC